jgi:hypothetical protein
MYPKVHTLADASLLEPTTKMEDPITMRHLRAVTKTVQSLGQSPQLNWRLPKKLPLRHHKAWEDLHYLIEGPQEIATEAPQSLGTSPQLNWRFSSSPLSHKAV